MRIRSIKPDFWRSPDITCLALADRLLFIGLWSYVDDNGVGQDRHSVIAADLFADDLSRDPRETLARVATGLASLAEHGRIVRYTVAGRDYLHITNWTDHQRIDRPNKPRYPLPTSDDAVIRETLARPSRDTREDSLPGAVEQGNRGTGEQETPPAFVNVTSPARANAPRTTGAIQALADTAHSLPAHKVAVAYSQWVDGGIDSRTLTEIAKEVDALIADKIDPHQIAAGIKAWHASDSWSPTQIRRFVTKAARAPDTHIGKPTTKARGQLDAAEALIAALESTA